MTKYEPQPIDVSQIELPRDLEPLLQMLAVNAHDEWALQRLNDGWIYGIHRNDAMRSHPCLVPFDDLPPEEQRYDRLLVESTLKAAIANGWKIARVETQSES